MQNPTNNIPEVPTGHEIYVAPVASSPPTAMRAKMSVTSVHKTALTEELRFNAVCKNEAYGDDGADEDNTYARYSPSAELVIVVANPTLWGKFLPGQKFYVDFTLAEK